MTVGYRLLHGDVLEQLATRGEQSVQCAVTSPPYWGLRDYGIEPSVWGGDLDHEHDFGDAVRIHKGGPAPGETSALANGNRAVIAAQVALSSRLAGGLCSCGAWRGCFGLEPTPELYVEHAVLVFREVWRVLRDDGTLWLNLGDSYATGAGAVGSSPGGGEQGERWARGVAVTGRGEPQVKRKGSNRAQRGDGNGGVGYGPLTQPNRPPIAGLKPKDLVGIPWRVAFALQADGWFLRSDIIWSKPNPMPESVRDRPTKAHEYLFLLSKSERYVYDADAIAEPVGAQTLKDRVDTGRFRPDRGYVGSPSAGAGRLGDSDRRNKRSVWTVATQPFPEAHFATFPEALIEPCILAGSRPGDVLLDPFSGAGTTGVVALRHGREYLGIEKNLEYLEMSRRRLSKIAPLFTSEIA